MTEDGREYVRVGRSLEFELLTGGGEGTRARVEDLGEGGAFIDTMNPYAVDEEFEFRLTLDDGHDPIAGKATVKWQQPAVGMGVEFLDLGKEERERIKFYVAAEFFRSFTKD